MFESIFQNKYHHRAPGKLNFILNDAYETVGRIGGGGHAF
jgi:hypothetical protein